MTFDEAIERVNEISEDQVEDRLDTAMWLIGELRKKYAPTIEMTQEAYNELNDLRSHNRDLDGVLSRAMFPYNPLIRYTTEELTQAWLHPETIKVIDEFMNSGD